MRINKTHLVAAAAGLAISMAASSAWAGPGCPKSNNASNQSTSAALRDNQPLADAVPSAEPAVAGSLQRSADEVDDDSKSKSASKSRSRNNVASASKSRRGSLRQTAAKLSRKSRKRRRRAN